jgi:hypothetical protein
MNEDMKQIENNGGGGWGGDALLLEWWNKSVVEVNYLCWQKSTLSVQS